MKFYINFAWLPIKSVVSCQFEGQYKEGQMQSNLCSLVFVLLTLIMHRSITMSTDYGRPMKPFVNEIPNF